MKERIDATETDHEEEASVTEKEDCLPFALTPQVTEKLQHSPVPCMSPPSPTVYTRLSPDVSESSGSRSSSSSSSSSLRPPPLVSSSVSSPGSQLSSNPNGEEYVNGSLLQSGSHYLEAAASLLLPNSTLGGSVLPPPTTLENLSSSHGSSVSGPGFSQLLNQAAGDGAGGLSLSNEKQQEQSSLNNRLPVLPEDQTVGTCGSSSSLPNSPPVLPPRRSRLGNSALMFSQQGSNIISAASMHHSIERRMAHLAGATASRTSDTSFQVAVDLSSSCTVQDAMEVVGNPDLLSLWCDPISSLIITQSSEGARNASNFRRRGGPVEAGRGEYEGEWIEASTTGQLIPPNNTGRILRAKQTVQTALGFPTLGKIVMFVERTRGQVGLTIGPFGGGVEVSHKLKMEQVSDCKIRIFDEVRLRRTEDGDSSCFCGLWDALANAFLLPKLDDYMDQVLSSMARLRFLIEHGETQSGYVPPTLEQEEENAALLSR